MKKFLLLSVLISAVFFCQAQTSDIYTPKKDTLTLNGNMWKGVKYSYQGVNNVDIRKVRKMLNIDSENAKLMREAKTRKVMSMVSVATGGLCIGASVNTWLAGGKFNVPLVVFGGQLMLISLPLSSASVKKMRQAVARFNTRP